MVDVLLADNDAEEEMLHVVDASAEENSAVIAGTILLLLILVS